ncbi:MAG TPA: lysylphosphatidylglycerol synthase transmembrane domain-containing protein [Dissulfurispiraceae bacterium]|nr:lysylphosphatidylglycerol synthase transmembrane domain-containing protein [Dissulfurispiraceae bacterium]
MSKKIKKALILSAKISVSTVLIIYLLLKVGGMSVIENAVLLSPVHFLSAVVLYLFAIYLSSLRWKLLVPRAVGLRRLFSMYMVGSFFNTCLPGIIGGDAVKAYYLNSELKKCPPDVTRARDLGNSAISVASVFMDRYIGLAALLSIGLAVFPAGFDLLRRTHAVWAMPLLLTGFIAASVLLFRFRLGERLRFLVGVYDYFSFYFAERRVLMKTFLYSLLVQLVVVASVYVLAQGMSLDVTFLSLLVFLPLIILIAMVPVSISGIGIREGAFVFFLGAIGVPPDKAMTLSILWFLSVVAAGLWGLVEYLRFKKLFGGGIKEQPL